MKREARSLRPSAELHAVLAALGAVAKLDAANAARYAPSGHEIEANVVAEWDRALGVALPDDVVVLLALQIPIVERALGKLAGPLDAPDVDDGKWVGAWSGDPFAMHPMSEDPTYQQPADMTVFLSLAPAIGDPRLMIVSTDSEARPRATTLSKFLLGRLATHFAAFEDDDDLSQAERADAERRKRAWKAAREAPLGDTEVASTFAAAIVGTAKPAFAEVRVTHPKLGPGTIVGLFEGTAEVVFDSGARKKIKRDFLKDL